MRIVLAMVLAAHGLAHFVSFVEAWRLIPSGFPYKTTILRGRVDLGDTGIRITGMLWLFVTIAFGVAAIGCIANATWWVPVALGSAAASLLLSSTEWPEARVGVMIDFAVLGVLPLAHWLQVV
jgi:hypothetical protein